MTATDSPLPPLNLKTKLGYGLGEVSKELPNSLLVFYLFYFLTNVAGLRPGLAGTVLLVGKIWDAFNDPLIGWLSDRTQSRWGRRFPWLMWGAAPLGISFALLWLTPAWEQTWQRFGYYTGALVLLYGAFTAIAIPHATLGAELTHTYDERTSLSGVRSVFSIGSSILGLLIAQAIFALGVSPGLRYGILGGVVGVIIMIAAFLCVWGTYDRYWQIQGIRPQPQATVSALPMAKQLQIAFSSRPFLCVMGIYFCSWVGLQTTAVTLQYFVVDYMQLSEQSFTPAVLAIQGTALLLMPIWGGLGQRLGKRAIYCCGIPITMIALLGLFSLQPGQVVLMYGYGMLTGIGVATAYLVPWAMLPDVMDLDELQTGRRREGLFCGIFVQVQKLGTALALYIVGRVLDQAGYIASRGQEQISAQPELALTTIRWLLGPVPVMMLMAGLAIAMFYPLTRERHQEILCQLKAQNSRTDPDSEQGLD